MCLHTNITIIICHTIVAGIKRIHCIDLENLVSAELGFEKCKDLIKNRIGVEALKSVIILTSHSCFDFSTIPTKSKPSRPPQQNIDACTPQWNDIKIALKAKTESDPIKAAQMIETTHYKQHLGSDLKASPTAGVIWDLKDPPGWDEV